MKPGLKKIKNKFDSANRYYNYGLIGFWILIIGAAIVFRADLFSNNRLEYPIESPEIFGDSTSNSSYLNCKQQSEPKIVSESKFLSTNTELGRYDLFLDTYTLGREKNDVAALASMDLYESKDLANCFNNGDLLIQFEYNNVKYNFPVNLLKYHLVINQDLANNRFLITYSPISDSYSVFVNNSELDFGISGRFIAGNMLMFDNQTDSLWAQLTGEALIGNRAGQQLELYPSKLVSYQEIKSCTNCLISNFTTGFDHDYSVDPYENQVIDTNAFGLDDFNEDKFGIQDKVTLVFANQSISAYDNQLLTNRIITDKVREELFTLELNNQNYPVAKTLAGESLLVVQANYPTIKEFYPDIKIRIEGQ